MDWFLYTVQTCCFPTWSDAICLCRSKPWLFCTLFGIFSLLFIYLVGWLVGCCSEMHCRCPAMACFMKIMSRWVEAVELLHLKKLSSPRWVPQAEPSVCVLRHTSTYTHAAKVILEVLFLLNKEANNSNRSHLLLCTFSRKSIWISFRRCGKLVLLNSINSTVAH